MFVDKNVLLIKKKGKKGSLDTLEKPNAYSTSCCTTWMPSSCSVSPISWHAISSVNASVCALSGSSAHSPITNHPPSPLPLRNVVVVRHRCCSSSSLFVVVVVCCRHCSTSSLFVVVVIRRRCLSLFVVVVIVRCRHRCSSLSSLFVVVIVVCRRRCLSSSLFVVVIARRCRCSLSSFYGCVVAMYPTLHSLETG